MPQERRKMTETIFLREQLVAALRVDGPLTSVELVDYLPPRKEQWFDSVPRSPCRREHWRGSRVKFLECRAFQDGSHIYLVWRNQLDVYNILRWLEKHDQVIGLRTPGQRKVLWTAAPIAPELRDLETLLER